MSDLGTLSVWTDLQCEGGTNVGELSTMTVATERWSVEQGWSCEVQVSPQDPSRSAIAKRRVLRWELTDGTIREYRIAEIDDARAPNATLVKIIGQDPRIDLAEQVTLSVTGSGGVVTFSDGRADLTPEEYLDDVIVPAATGAGLAVSKGTVTPAPQLSLDWEDANDLGLTLQVVEGVQNRGLPCELDYRRNGSTDYQIDLVSAIGSGATTPELHVGRHIPRWDRRDTTTDQASRVFPRGGVDGTGAKATIAHAAWVITAKAANVLTLEDPMGGAGPIQFTNQHADPNGDWYLVDTDGSLIQVTASARTNATQSSVTLASTPTAAVDDLVEFRADASGTYLASLIEPTAMATYGELQRFLDRPALRGERNLCPNPWARDWPVSTNPPTGWSWSAANGTKTRETTTPPTNFGPYSIRVSVPMNNQWIVQTPMCPVFPVTGDDLFTVSISMTAYTAGSELFVFVVDPDHSTPNSSVTYLGIFYVPANQIPIGNRFDLTIAGLTCPANTTRIYVDLHNSNVISGVFGAYDIAIDAVNVTQTANAADEFFEHPRANALWQAGNAYLADWASPTPEFSGSLIDFARIDPTAWASVSVARGASTRVIDDVRGLDYTIRAVAIEWNRLVSGDTRIQWSARPKTLFANGNGSLGRRALLSGGPSATNPNAPGVMPNPTPPVNGMTGGCPHSGCPIPGGIQLEQDFGQYGTGTYQDWYAARGDNNDGTRLFDTWYWGSGTPGADSYLDIAKKFNCTVAMAGYYDAVSARGSGFWTNFVDANSVDTRYDDITVFEVFEIEPGFDINESASGSGLTFASVSTNTVNNGGFGFNLAQLMLRQGHMYFEWFKTGAGYTIVDLGSLGAARWTGSPRQWAMHLERTSSTTFDVTITLDDPCVASPTVIHTGTYSAFASNNKWEAWDHRNHTYTTANGPATGKRLWLWQVGYSDVAATYGL